MGRGQETDLLFNPPRIHRDKKPSLNRGRRGAFERTVSGLIVGISFITMNVFLLFADMMRNYAFRGKFSRNAEAPAKHNR